MDPHAYNTIFDFGPLLSMSWWWYLRTFFAIALGWSCAGMIGELLNGAILGLLRFIRADIEAARFAVPGSRAHRQTLRVQILERRRRERDARK